MKTNRLRLAVCFGAALLASASVSQGRANPPTNCTTSSQQPSKVADIVDTAWASGSFKTLVAAVKAAGLVDALKQPGPFTVFAPTDEAFAKLPAGTLESLLKPENKQQLANILTYHVVKGEVPAAQAMKLTAGDTLNGQRFEILTKESTLVVDEARVIKADIRCSNGIIHVIDKVLIPSSDDIVETASKAGSFQTLLTAAKAAGLVEALQGNGPLTVFAPTDEAFAKLGPDAIASLLKPENKQKLANILKHHVVSGRVFSDQLLKAGQARTLSGAIVEFTNGASPKIDKANIISTDIDASNGVIHVIDSVLLPSGA